MATEQATIRIDPQPKQAEFLSTSADIAIMGGAAYGGKTYALLMEPLRHIENADFRATIFRRTIPQVRAQGGLWDTSQKLYRLAGGESYEQALEWRFPSGMRIRFAHMEHEKNRFDWASSQIPLIGFDQLEQFEQVQFWFMLSRNRSSSGVPGYVRATCNPDPDSWLRSFIAWWIDDKTGYARQDRSGVVRWFIRVNDRIEWADTKEELASRGSPMSVTFVPALPEDNPIGINEDPDYITKLDNLFNVEREQLKKGNWNVRAVAGSYFRREWFEIVDAAPANVTAKVRFWDRAATPLQGSNDPDATIGLKMSKDMKGIYYVEDVRKMFDTPFRVESAMQACAQQDGINCTVAYHQDPGSAGVAEAQSTATALSGSDVRFQSATGSKEVRAKAVSAQCEAGNVKLVRGQWNEEFLRVIEGFPTSPHDDEVDALSGAFNKMCSSKESASTIFRGEDTEPTRAESMPRYTRGRVLL